MKIKELKWDKYRCNYYKAYMKFGNNYNLFSYGETNGNIFAMCHNLNLAKRDLQSLEFAKDLCEQTYKEECEKIYNSLFEN